jgi:hypothetical protein
MPEGLSPAYAGTQGYDGFPASFEEYLRRIEEQPPGDHQRFLNVKQAVYARQNVYAGGARPFAGERDAVTLEDTSVSVVAEGDEVYLVADLPASFDGAGLVPVGGRDLERVRFADAEFEERDGSPAVIATDLTGVGKDPRETYPAGPLAGLTAGSHRVRIW